MNGSNTSAFYVNPIRNNINEAIITYDASSSEINYSTNDMTFGLTSSWSNIYTASSPGNRQWQAVSISSAGQYQTAVVNGGNIWISSDSGITWIEKNSGVPVLNQAWQSVSISADGTIQTAVVNGGNIWISSNSGATWTFPASAGSRNWYSVSVSSASGQYQTALDYGSGPAGGLIWRSLNYGVSWASRPYPSQHYCAVSVSSTGQYQTALVENGYIWISSSTGGIWTAVLAPGTQIWKSVSVSADGIHQTAVVNGGNIWTSDTSGNTWTEKVNGNAGGLPPNQAWTSVSVSSSAQYRTAIVQNGNIWISSDYGVNWISVATSLSWSSVSISSTGQYQTAVVQGGNIWRSSNYGANINSVFVPGRMAVGKTTIIDGYTLDVSGNVNATSYSSTSDYRIKDNVQPITRTIDELRPRSYFNRLSGKEDMGFIAHEMQEHFPFLVNGEKDGEDYQSVNYLGLVGLLVKEFQEIKATTTDLEHRMTNLENQK